MEKDTVVTKKIKKKIKLKIKSKSSSTSSPDKPLSNPFYQPPQLPGPCYFSRLYRDILAIYFVLVGLRSRGFYWMTQQLSRYLRLLYRHVRWALGIREWSVHPRDVIGKSYEYFLVKKLSSFPKIPLYVLIFVYGKLFVS